MTAAPTRPDDPDLDGTVHRSATRTAVTVLGLLAGAAAVEHGVGEILQGPGAPGSVTIESWPDSEAFAAVAGEPAMTVLPDLLLSGVVTVVVAAGLAVHLVRLAPGRHQGVVLLGLAVLLLLVGGGFGPPLLLMLLAVALMLPADTPREPTRVRRWVAAGWRPLLAVTVAAYLGLVPGTLLLHVVAGEVGAGLVAVLTGTAFAGLLLTLVAARADDQLRTLVPAGPAGGAAD